MNQKRKKENDEFSFIFGKKRRHNQLYIKLRNFYH